jgi:RNA ligase (TIGR02306 family)
LERKLVSVQRILSLTPIPNADKIEKAQILGWELVVKKDEFKVGETCVYCEVDSILPERSEFEFLRERKFRIKTIKMKGQVSQGIAFPLSILPESIYNEGDDVTEILGVKKWEPYVPAQLRGQIKGNFPSFLHKTDEIRIQTVPDVLERHKGKEFYVSEKLDGSSMSAYFNEGTFGVCSRNLDLKETEENAFWKMARSLDLENKFKQLGYNVAIQGELIGNGIQKNKYQYSKVELRVFNVFNIDSQKYLDYMEFLEVTRDLGLLTVPIVECSLTLNHTVSDLVNYSSGNSILCLSTIREGLVFRPRQESYDSELGRLSFKAINPEFLLKYGDE